MARRHAYFLVCVRLHLTNAPRRGWQSELRREQARVRRDKRMRSRRATRLRAARAFRRENMWRPWRAAAA